MNDLTKKHCVPCEGGTPPFIKDEALAYMKQVVGWELLEEKRMRIKREFVFKNFKQAMEFVNKVAALAEEEGHHPDINLHNYRRVDITLYTHAIGGLSENDFILAAKINEI